MSLRNVLAICAAALSVSAMAIPTYTFTSATLANVGDVNMNFTQNLVLDVSATQPKFGNVSMLFRVDTHYVDFAFTDGSTVTMMSSITGNSSYGLTANGLLLSDPAYGALGAGPAGNVTPVAGQPGVYDVNIAFSKTTATFLSPSGNLLVGGDGLPLKIVVHTTAIAALPTHTYAFAPSGNGPSVVLIGNGAANRATVQAANAGGVFVVVPEPSSVVAMITGLSGIIAIRRRKA